MWVTVKSYHERNRSGSDFSPRVEELRASRRSGNGATPISRSLLSAAPAIALILPCPRSTTQEQLTKSARVHLSQIRYQMPNMLLENSSSSCPYAWQMHVRDKFCERCGSLREKDPAYGPMQPSELFWPCAHYRPFRFDRSPTFSC